MPRNVMDCISYKSKNPLKNFQRAARAVLSVTIMSVYPTGADAQRVTQHKMIPVAPGTTVSDIIQNMRRSHRGGPRVYPIPEIELSDISYLQKDLIPGNPIYTSGYIGAYLDGEAYIYGFTNQNNPVPMYAACAEYDENNNLVGYLPDNVDSIQLAPNQNPPPGTMSYPSSVPASTSGMPFTVTNGSYYSSTPYSGGWSIIGSGTENEDSNPTCFGEKYSGWINLLIANKDGTPTITATRTNLTTLQTTINQPDNGYTPLTQIQASLPVGPKNPCSIEVPLQNGGYQTVSYANCPWTKVTPFKTTTLVSNFTFKPPNPVGGAPGAVGEYQWANLSIPNDDAFFPMVNNVAGYLPVPTVLTTCYIGAIESEYGNAANGTCRSIPYKGTIWSGTIPGAHTPPSAKIWPGLPGGTYCAAAMMEGRLQGTMDFDLHGNNNYNWVGGHETEVQGIKGSDGRFLQALFSIAADRVHIFNPTPSPNTPYSVTLSGSGAAEPDDSGSRIQDYHVDMWTGWGEQTCDDWEYKSEQQLIGSDPVGINNSVPKSTNSTGVSEGTTFPSNQITPIRIKGRPVRPKSQQNLFDSLQHNLLLGPIK